MRNRIIKQLGKQLENVIIVTTKCTGIGTFVQKKLILGKS